MANVARLKLEQISKTSNPNFSTTGPIFKKEKNENLTNEIG